MTLRYIKSFFLQNQIIRIPVFGINFLNKLSLRVARIGWPIYAASFAVIVILVTYTNIIISPNKFQINSGEMSATGERAAEDLDYARNAKFWEDRWAENKIGWHKSTVNPYIVTYLPELTEGKSNRKVFVPLCGKTLDIPFLYQQGHRVFGVEVVPKAIEELSEEHSLGLKFHPESSTYATDDGRIVIYCGDIFTCPFEKFGPFDCVWDRGSFIAFEYQFRTAYKAMMQRSLQIKEEGAGDKLYHDFRYLLNTVDYDREKFGGPPRAVDAKDMEEFFGDWTNIETVTSVQEFGGSVASKPNIGPVTDTVYLLTPKK